MKRALVAVVSLAVVSFGAIGVPTASSEAASHTHHGESAKRVAKQIGCKRLRREGGGKLHLDSGVCWLRGKRVSLITFKGARQQRDWNVAAKMGLPSNHYWANGRGAVVTAYNGNKAAAKIGAKRLPGRVVHAY